MTDKSAVLLRPQCTDLDRLLGVNFPVLDDGFIRVVDYMGTDASIVQAARVSYGVGTKKVSEDRGLIRYLLRNRHTTPFEMCEIKLHVRVPMDCWRQWIRHRTASVNEYSTRYSVAINACQKTEPDEWRIQSDLNKQGSGTFLDNVIGTELTATENELHHFSKQVYEKRLECGVAREQARKDLPLSSYTEAYWKIDLHNLLHFLSLRMDSHAQYEIREYANVIGNEIVSKWVPYTWDAFQNYRLKSLSLSADEIKLLTFIVNGKTQEALQFLEEEAWLRKTDDGAKESREAKEFKLKLVQMGLKAFW